MAIVGYGRWVEGKGSKVRGGWSEEGREMLNIYFLPKLGFLMLCSLFDCTHILRPQETLRMHGMQENYELILMHAHFISMRHAYIAHSLL